MLAAFFDRIVRALTPHPPPPFNPATPTYPARPRTIHSRVQFFKAPPPSFDSGIPSSSSFDFGTPSPHHYKAPPSFSFGTSSLPQNTEVPPPSSGSGASLPSLRFIPAVFGHNPAVNCALVLSSHVSRNTSSLPTSPSPPPVATPDLRSPPDFSPPNFSSPRDFSPPDISSPPDSPLPNPPAVYPDYPPPTEFPLPNSPSVVSPDHSSPTAYVDYVCDGSPFLQFSHLSNPPPYVPGGLPPPSFDFGPAESEKMSEPKPPTTRSSDAAHRAASEDNKDGSSASEIPYFKLHTMHLSVLRGQIKYLEILNRKKGCEGKLDKMIAGYVQIIKDAKAAATTAGIVRNDSKPADKRKSRPSVSFAEKDEIFVSPAYKKTKAKPVPITILKPRRGNAGKRKPTAEALATLRSCLGKRNRSTTESTSEDEEDAPLKPFKRPRPRIFQEGDPLGKYVGDPDTEDEDEDSDSDSFKSATSKSEPTTVDNPADVISSPVAAPADTEDAKPVPSTTSSVPIAETSKPAMPASQTKHTANDKPAAKKSAKKQRQASVSEDIEIDTSSSGDFFFAIRPPLPGKHAVDGEAGGQRSAKKQKQKSTPGTSTGSASAPASAPAPAPATNAQTPTKRSASGAGASQSNTKRNKK